MNILVKSICVSLLLLLSFSAPAMAQATDGPTMAATLKKSGVSGWDVSLVTANFPAGHADISIDGKKTAEIDGNSYHLDGLPAGVHEVKIGLIGADGQAITSDGKPVVARFAIRTKPGSAAPTGEPKIFDLPVVNAKIAGLPDTIRITQGDTVQFHWSSDVPMEIHLHGYDIEVEVSPDSPVTMLFDADLAGRFSVEKHGKPEATLFYLEVYPK